VVLVTAADWTRSIAAGLAIAFVFAALFLILRPAQSPEPVFVPRTFSPAPTATPHCIAATIGPAGLHSLPDCKGATP
jgi:hypothetical protein